MRPPCHTSRRLRRPIHLERPCHSRMRPATCADPCGMGRVRRHRTPLQVSLPVTHPVLRRAAAAVHRAANSSCTSGRTNPTLKTCKQGPFWYSRLRSTLGSTRRHRQLTHGPGYLALFDVASRVDGHKSPEKDDPAGHMGGANKAVSVHQDGFEGRNAHAGQLRRSPVRLQQTH